MKLVMENCRISADVVNVVTNMRQDKKKWKPDMGRFSSTLFKIYLKQVQKLWKKYGQ